MDKRDEAKRPPAETTPVPVERPPVEFHDPFGRFDFEPTDGGDF